MLLAETPHGAAAHVADSYPGLLSVAPFILILLSIALLPVISRVTEHWWHKNSNKLLLAVALALVTLIYYGMRGYGFHGTDPGIPTVLSILHHSVLAEYIPFMSLLFSLYVISGGIAVRGDIPAHPRTNLGFLSVGGALASLIGTTGASMLLIRPLLRTNQERRYKAHTVIFFIFIVSNIGGTMLPIGDPPLFLGYLRGVPFFWTLNLWKVWLVAMGVLLVAYYIWDVLLYRRETPSDIRRDETQVEKLSISGKINFLWLAGVIFVTATLGTSKPFPGTDFIPFPFLREGFQILFVILSLVTTPRGLRKENNFNYVAILEVACLFIGIFICMQTPIEILNHEGPRLGVNTPARFFWATGALSSFLDNAPTYVVFFETANSLTQGEIPGETIKLLTGQIIRIDHLVAISLGAVFMGAMTYIGNGPNFMVRSIAEHEGVRMPSFFGYMIYSCLLLLPVFGLLTLLFFL